MTDFRIPTCLPTQLKSTHFTLPLGLDKRAHLDLSILPVIPALFPFNVTFVDSYASRTTLECRCRRHCLMWHVWHYIKSVQNRRVHAKSGQACCAGQTRVHGGNECTHVTITVNIQLVRYIASADTGQHNNQSSY